MTLELDKANEPDTSGFQAFTIRNLNNNLSTESDIEQHKLFNVREDPIKRYHDMVCFPTLYPTGKHEPREIKVTVSLTNLD